MTGTASTTAPPVQLELPPMYCPIEYRVQPELEAIDRNAAQWLDRYQPYHDSTSRAWLVAADAATAVASFLPNGSTDRVELSARWMYWALALDDVTDRSTPGSGAGGAAELVSRVLRLMETPQPLDPPGTGLAPALQSFIADYQAMASPPQLRRFVEGHRRWFLSVCWQATTSQPRTLDDYCHLRMLSVGACATAVLTEFTHPEEVPSNELDSPAMRALQESAYLVLGLDNDLLSHFGHDVRERDVPDVVTTIARLYQVPTDEALVQATALRDLFMDLFLRLQERLLPRVSSPTRHYIENLGFGIRGDLEWGARSARYAVLTPRDQPPPAEFTPITLNFAERPAPAIVDHRSLPSLSWWWNHLTPQ
ncbi:terpene synthase family protein [Saccharomonospora sp. NPDC046836]|uniref:terpene synthase family protein n=1 Tax=Saccharomonospora sp. NPDC046836 TaxID=3156921 RepID=UPI0033EC7117